MRFDVPLTILVADYSHVLQEHGVTLFAQTTATSLRLHQHTIPAVCGKCALSLDGLLEHDTELNPAVCYTLTHCYTEVVINQKVVGECISEQ